MKSISPLIASILLMVVALVIIIIVIDWSKAYVNTSTDLTSNINVSPELALFIVAENFQDNSNGSFVILKNNSNKDINISGYYLNYSEDIHFSNKYFNYASSYVLNKNQSVKLPLICFPSKNLKIIFKTTDNEYFEIKLNNVIITNTCANLFEKNKFYTFEELLSLNYLDLNQSYIDLNGDLNLPNISNFIIKTKFKLNSLTTSNTLMSYKYSGNIGYTSTNRSGFKLQLISSRHIIAVGSMDGSSYWWGGWDEFAEPFQSQFKFPPSNEYYEVILFKNGKDFSACYYDASRNILCSEVWNWPYGYNLTNIYYTSSYNPKTLVGASNLGHLNTFAEYFNGSIDYIEMYHYSPENVTAAKNNLPLDNYVFKIDLTK